MTSALALAKETLKEEQIDLVLCDIIIRGPDGSTLPQGGLSLISHILLHVRPRPQDHRDYGSEPFVESVATCGHDECRRKHGKAICHG